MTEDISMQIESPVRIQDLLEEFLGNVWIIHQNIMHVHRMQFLNRTNIQLKTLF